MKKEAVAILYQPGNQKWATYVLNSKLDWQSCCEHDTKKAAQKHARGVRRRMRKMGIEVHSRLGQCFVPNPQSEPRPLEKL